MKQARVLIIDDSITIRAMIEELLSTQAQCHAIATAADVPTARRLIEDFCPTLITLDLNMPGIDGYDFLEELALRPTPVIVVSSSITGDCALSKELLSQGADACFDKSKIISDAKLFIRALKKATIEKSRMIRPSRSKC